ncbi:MAG: hypothetical protein KF773_16490 [Deltaproteobacteria bacterium]|nr:hypothetical protein [Deltaproteobacteria bacterium]
MLGLAGVASPAPDIPARFPVWYPLLPYSPEYVAIREAAAIGAEVVFIDLPHHALIEPATPAAPADELEAPEDEAGQAEATAASWEAIAVESSFYQAMAKAAGYRSWDEAWDSMFELGLSSGRHATHEEFRRDLAHFCAAVRATSGDRPQRDGTIPRERHMLQAIRRGLAARRLAPAEAMVVCGGFHLFLDRDDAEPPPEPPKGTSFATVVPYSYFRVSELAGYGAGNRAPKYYQTVWEQLDRRPAAKKKKADEPASPKKKTRKPEAPAGEATEGGGAQVVATDKRRGGAAPDEPPHVDAMIEHVSHVLSRGRRAGEMFTAADAIATTQHARMLAALRGRPAPALDDIRDALISCCCKGRPEEEGRGLLRAMAEAEVGTAIGRVTPALGRLPIVHDFHEQLDALDLGEVMGRDKRMHVTLDLRDDAGARRSAFLHRLVKLAVPLVESAPAATGDGTTLFREKWTLAWSPAVDAQLVEKNLYGDTIEAAAMAQLEEEIAADARHAGATAGRLRASVAMQLPRVVQRLEAAARAAIDEDRRFNSQCEALVHLLVLDRLAIQRDLGRPAIADLAHRAYTRACLAIGDLGALPADQQEETIGHLKSLAEAAVAGDLVEPLDRAAFTDAVTSAALAATVPFMQGAFAGLLAELKVIDPADLAARVGAFATSHPARMVVAGEFLDGAFAVSKTSLLLGADALVSAIDELLRAAPWDEFMTLLPKVRNAFERLHERQRLAFADRVAARYGLAGGEAIAEVPVTSDGAAAYLATLDARVAAIMKDWSF